VLFLTFLDTTIVSVTLGDVQHDLGAGVISLQWVVNAYALVFASLMLLAGSLADRYGRRRVMWYGLLFFAGGSVLAARADAVGWLITGRAVMGVGAAAAEPGTLSILRQLYPDPGQRAKALGAWSAVSGLSLAAGPVIGGLLVGAAGWRAVFWFNLVCVVLLAVALRRVPESRDRAAGPADVGGFLLGSTALAALVFAVITGENHGYLTWWVLALFALAAVLLPVFVQVERRAAAPMVVLADLRRPVVVAALLVAFAVYFGVFALFFFSALYLDAVVGYSGWRLAGVFAPLALTMIIASITAGRWVARRGATVPMATGCAVAAVGMLLTRAAMDSNPSFGPVALAMAVAGAGIGTAVVPLTAAVLAAIPARRSGMAASATNTARQLGAVFGIAALGALVNASLTGDLTDRLAHAGYGRSLQNLVITAVENGAGAAGGIDLQHVPPFLAPLVQAAGAAFLTGLRTSLLVAAGAVLIAGAVAATARDVRSPRPAARRSGPPRRGRPAPARRSATVSPGRPRRWWPARSATSAGRRRWRRAWRR
jgi:EmrB/QacA subfamily drug resistance transporter